MTAVAPPEHHAHFGCPTCGRLFTLPYEAGEAAPFCVHHDSTVVWREPSGPQVIPWTRVRPIEARFT